MEGGEGLRAIPPALRHTSIPPGDSHGVNRRRRVEKLRRNETPGNNTPPPSFCTYPPLLAILEG